MIRRARPGLRIAGAMALLLAAGPLGAAPSWAEQVVMTPPAQRQAHESGDRQVALFSGGCFWGVEAVFSHVRGVASAVSGYQGGAKSTAAYELVSEGDTGHAESVEVAYDPHVVRYDQLLQIFFAVIADPTQRDRQGPDAGTQYRSALVPLNEEQRQVASAYLAQLGGAHLWGQPIVTRIEPMRGFYPAEAEHQDFMLRNPGHPYIRYWDAPKVEALRRLFPGFYQAKFTRG